MKFIAKYKALFPSIIAILILSVAIVCSSISFAWYTDNKETTTNTPGIQAGHNTISFDYFVYKYNTELYVIEDVTGEEDQFTMNAYDSIILSRNIHTSLIIKLEISGAALSEEQDIYCDITCSNETIDDMCLSNAIQFKFGFFDIDEEDAEDIYLTAESEFNKINEKYRFKDGSTKEDLIRFIIDNSHYSESTIDLYIQVDYAQDLISELSTFDITDLTADNVVTYTGDIEKLEIGLVEVNS